MPHPFFEAIKYPWHRADALEFWQALYAAIPERTRIKRLHGQCGSGLRPLALETAPDLIWQEALEGLCAASRLRPLCHAILEDPSVTAIHPQARAVRDAMDLATHLDRIISDSEEKAILYSPLQGSAAEQQNRVETRDKALRLFRSNVAHGILCRQYRSPEDQQAPEKRKEYVDARDAFRDMRSAAILGEPGAGKSTTLRRLALDLATKAKQDPEALVPIVADLGNWTSDEPLGAFLAPQRHAIPENRAIAYLLDGLNEMPTAKQEEKAREIAKLEGSARVWVSCRAGDYMGVLHLDIEALTLESLTPPRIRAVLHHWMNVAGEPPELADDLFWQLAGDPKLRDAFQESKSTEEEFWREPVGEEDWSAHYRRKYFSDARRLLKLAANPFLLSMLFQVWNLSKHSLPTNRGDLFRWFVLCLLKREELAEDANGGLEVTQEGQQLLDALAELAWQMQQSSENPDSGVLTVVERAVTLQALQGEERLRLAIAATILEGSERIKFRHQLLQEYFAAVALDRKKKANHRAAELWPADRWWERTGWEEPAVLLAGLYPEDCSTVIAWLMEANPKVAVKALRKSGASLLDADAVRRVLRERWKTSLLTERAAAARAAIGRALDLLGLDDRRGVGVRDGLPDIEWVRMPACEFLYQEEMEKRRLEEYEIGKYPVTNAQYEVFVQAEDGYNNDRWWRGMAVPAEHRRPEPPRWREGNHPREMVSWWEAMAFCRWLSARTGWNVGLPTEEEWERAARGEEGREYPWGEGFDQEKANTSDGEIGRTTPVGIYPGGSTQEGAEEMAGNVWEWCLSEYVEPERIHAGGTALRCLRGGSWGHSSGYARSVVRSAPIHAYDRFYICGFRLVRRSLIMGR